MSIQKLREERNEKARDYRNTLDKCPQDAPMSEETSKKLDTLRDEITALEDRINREEYALNLAAENLKAEEAAEKAVGAAGGKSTQKELFAKWLAHGDNGLSAEDWEKVRAEMSTTTPSEGGYTIQTDVASSVIEALKEFGGMREVSTVFTTDQGNPMNYPTSDGTSEEGEIVPENTAATDEDVSFGTKNLPVYKFSSKVVTVPIELLQDSSIDLEAFIRSRIVERLGRATNRFFTVGTGTNQPLGIVTAAGSGKTGSAADAVTYEELVDVEHSVDPAYRRNAPRWMFHDTTLREVRKLKDSQGRPLWMPDIIGGSPATILGHGYTINQNMAPMAANAKSILFGQLSKYVIRDVMQVTFYRFTDSAYAKKGQVGFLAFMRSGGNLMDVGGAVKAFTNAGA